MVDEIVSVPVPRQYLAQVYRVIAELDAGARGVSAQPTPVAAEAGEDEWTPARIRRMVEESDETMRNILEAMAKQPGTWLTSEDLAKAIKSKTADWNTVAGALGAFSRRLSNRYGLESMPYQKRREPGAGKVFQMTKEMAQQILRALKNGH